MKPTVFPWKTLCWTTVFAIAMGFLETSVVVYLRALLYPAGFAFPLAPIPQSLAVTELCREAATLVMLIGIGYLSGRNGITRFACFLYAFAIWDIFYYIFLKVLIHWPESFMTWDILFLIPVTWIGPVVSPLIVSLTMILLALTILYFDSHNSRAKMNIAELTLQITGSMVLILSFTWDYSGFILSHYHFWEIWSAPTDDLLKLAQTYVPRQFNWFLFILAELIILTGIALYYRRMKKISKG